MGLLGLEVRVGLLLWGNGGGGRGVDICKLCLLSKDSKKKHTCAAVTTDKNTRSATNKRARVICLQRLVLKGPKR